MLREMGIRGKAKWGGYQAQHIIPAEMATHPVLKKIGMDLDHANQWNLFACSQQRYQHRIKTPWLSFGFLRIR